MKKTMYFNMNAPEYSDPIDVKNLSDNFNVIDYGLMTSRCSKSRTTNSINERAVLPYYKIVNDNEFDVVVVNRNFDNVETTIKAGEELKVNVSDINRSMNYMVKDLHEVTFEWFITVEDAIKEGGGGSGGTSNYNDLTNKPQINGTTLSGNKTLADIGITNSSGKIKSDLLPAFVDNYDSYANRAAFPATGVEDRLYLAKDTRLSYVWDSGTSDYVVVGSPLALGESSTTAYRGDRGKTAYDHSQATHANVNATVVATSTTNGNIKIDGVEKTVYTHPKATGSSGTNPHGTTASDVGLGNVGNYKAVSTASQSLSDTEKSTARANIGAGTSSFDGKYSSLSGIPSTFTPAAHSHAGSEIALNATSYSKDTEQKTISKDTNVDKAIAQLEYRTDVLEQNKVDKTTVSSSISSSKCTIEVPEKAKAVAVCTMKGHTQKVVQYITITDGTMTLAGVTVSRSNGVCTFSGTATSTTVATMSTITNKIVPNHVYLFTQKYDTVKGAYAQILVNESKLWTLVSNKSMIYTAPSSVTSATFRLHVEVSQTYGGNKIIPQLFDLTAMGIKIGSTDAETISNFEQAIKDLYVAPTDGVLWNAANESVVSKNSSNKIIATAEIPISIRNLKDYGCGLTDQKYNWIDFENGIYHHKYVYVRLADLEWKQLSSATNVKYNNTYGYADGRTYKTVENGIICSNRTVNTTGASTMTAGQIRIADSFYVYDEGDVSGTKGRLGESTAVIELATEELIDISDIIRPLKVESGGTVTFVNEHNIDCDTVVKYKKEV